MLTYYKNILYEAGCDEAGRGCLAGPVYAAAVMLDPEHPIDGLNDSKKLSKTARQKLRKEIEEKAACWAVVAMDAGEIDRINILKASLSAMAQAVLRLSQTPVFVLVDGHMNIPGLPLEQQCFVKGDARFQSIAAASILAKTHRDAYMESIHHLFPVYGWNQNKGYPTELHRKAIVQFGLSDFHRKSFTFKHAQLNLFDESVETI
ncbi:MAG: ribonuclease HII [Saprospiraceae bacterium]|nr:ribonuclease HII [Saprospiraceae bacterium]